MLVKVLQIFEVASMISKFILLDGLFAGIDSVIVSCNTITINFIFIHANSITASFHALYTRPN